MNNHRKMHTKIVCTIGPASESKARLKKMIQAGMTVARLNFSHGDYKSHAALIKHIRQGAEELGRDVGIMADLQGPRIRVADLSEDIKIIEGQVVYLVGDGDGKQNSPARREAVIGVDGVGSLQFLKKGNPVFIDNGMMELVVVGKKGAKVMCRVKVGGTVKKRKGVNIPGISRKIGALTDVDKDNLRFALAHDIDFVAMSFVKTARDILDLKKLIKKHLPGCSEKNLPTIIAKIETEEAVVNFDSILRVVDGVMIARGDLAIEMPLEKIPAMQKEMVTKCLHNAKPVIVATQMLESMMENPRPTRAEITDVANAVIDHADALMLSGESAMGKYPVKSVQVMAKIAQHTETGPYDDIDYGKIFIKHLVPFTLVAKAAVLMAHEMNIRNIIIRNTPLAMAYKVARFRQPADIWYLTKNRHEARRLSLVWGVRAVADAGEVQGDFVLIDGVSRENGRIEYRISHKIHP